MPVRRGCSEEPRVARLPLLARPALFLDRDGVLNVEYGFVHSVERFEWIPGALELVQAMNQRGWWVFVVTNQSGIGKGLCTEPQFLELTAWMDEQLAARSASVECTYYCPHHPDANCPARKPGTGMLERAVHEYPIDKTRSILIGDRESDQLAAHNFGIPGFLFPGGDLFEFFESLRLG